jgi:hypothetical protein
MRAIASQRDLEFNMKGGPIARITTNRTKLLGIFIAKSITKHQSQYAGKVIFSESESDYEG